jgi:alkylation response protein AidB-like acyl-CoA dehydrogenase
MKTEQRLVYISRDGRDFPTAAKCLSHERATCGAALVGLTEAQVEAARTWADPELAEAIEIFGAQLRKARQASGALKRRPRPNGPEPDQGVGVEEGP